VNDKIKLYLWRDGIHRERPEPTPPRDTYDLAEMITAKVQAGTWTAQAVADAIQKYMESIK